jgi:propanediol dehydratase small subunit
MKPYEIYFFIVLFLVSVALALLGKGNLESYWKRRCTGNLWKRRYPLSPKKEIRTFLDIFVDAFHFKKSRRLAFAPSDKVMDIYETKYPPKWTMLDALELEVLAMNFQKIYGVNLERCWRTDITLGELFELTQSPPQVTPPKR